MLGYYLELAIRNLRRNVALTALIVAAVGVGIGASMTEFGVMRALSGDPSGQVLATGMPQIDVWARTRGKQSGAAEELPDQLSYRDAMAFIRAQGLRQTAMYGLGPM